MASLSLLKNDEQSFFRLLETVRNYYKSNGRFVAFLSYTPPATFEEYEVAFLFDRKHVAKYMIGLDRFGNTGGLALAIGPHYFGPSDFWSYENSQRFTLEASTEGVEKNLLLLDEFLGYPVKPLFTP